MATVRPVRHAGEAVRLTAALALCVIAAEHNWWFAEEDEKRPQRSCAQTPNMQFLPDMRAARPTRTSPPTASERKAQAGFCASDCPARMSGRNCIGVFVTERHAHAGNQARHEAVTLTGTRREDAGRSAFGNSSRRWALRRIREGRRKAAAGGSGVARDQEKGGADHACGQPGASCLHSMRAPPQTAQTLGLSPGCTSWPQSRPPGAGGAIRRPASSHSPQWLHT